MTIFAGFGKFRFFHSHISYLLRRQINHCCNYSVFHSFKDQISSMFDEMNYGFSARSVSLIYGFYKLMQLLPEDQIYQDEFLLAILMQREDLAVRWIKENKVDVNKEVEVATQYNPFILSVVSRCNKIIAALIENPTFYLKSYNSNIEFFSYYKDEMGKDMAIIKNFIYALINDKIHPLCFYYLPFLNLDLTNLVLSRMGVGNLKAIVFKPTLVNFVSCNFQNVSFQNSILNFAFFNCNLTGADFSGASLNLQSIFPYAMSSTFMLDNPYAPIPNNQLQSINIKYLCDLKNARPNLKEANFFRTRILINAQSEDSRLELFKLFCLNQCNFYFATFVPINSSYSATMPDNFQKILLNCFFQKLAELESFTELYQFFIMLRDAKEGVLRVNVGTFTNSYTDTIEYKHALFATCEKLFEYAKTENAEYFPEIIAELKRCPQPYFRKTEWQELTDKFEQFTLTPRLTPSAGHV